MPSVVVAVALIKVARGNTAWLRQGEPAADALALAMERLNDGLDVCTGRALSDGLRARC